MSSISTSRPTLQTAVIASGPGQLAIKHDAPMPALTPEMVLVKTVAVAINPADAKMLDYSAAVGAIHGYDFAGTIVELGADAPSHLAVGDRVAGFVHGMDSLQPDVGAFAEYVGASGHILLKIPKDMRFEDAASLGVGVATAGLGLFKELKVPATMERPAQTARRPFVLVCGGSTSTGTRAIQMLKLYDTSISVPTMPVLIFIVKARSSILVVLHADKNIPPALVSAPSLPAPPRVSPLLAPSVLNKFSTTTAQPARRTSGLTPRIRWHTRWTAYPRPTQHSCATALLVEPADGTWR